MATRVDGIRGGGIMAMDWFRFYSEFMDDPKISMMSDSDQLIWVKSLCLASESKKRGYILLTDEEICWKLRVSMESWKHAVDKFRAKGMLEHSAKGYKISNWESRQFQSDCSTPRVQKSRQAKKSAETVKRYNTVSCNVTETPPDTDTDTDTDKPPLNTPPRKPKNRVEYTTDFQTFWDVYPEKTGKGKAYEEWVKIRMSESLFSEIIDSVNKHIEHSQKWQNGYIPNPATFLHQRRWEDQPDGHKKIRSAVDIGIARFLAKGEDDE
jgi:hypothetical protein